MKCSKVTNAECPTIREIAAAEKINESYVGRVIRLTLLAPDIVEAILGGRQPASLQLDRLVRGFRWDGRPSAKPSVSQLNLVVEINSEISKIDPTVRGCSGIGFEAADTGGAAGSSASLLKTR